MKLLTVDEAAKYLRYAPSYMRKLVMLNKVPYIKFGRAVRFNKDDLDKFITEHRVDAKSAY
ncbi:helix-turn-helix domain-containing protein [Pleomorphochaeta sp. DL1XJH-081]|uniref:helix-turn-helix domain-containing protein n=1 Tax=Pleomorphochaeta sp. DL1XJH-081 TaxID=3409690 RepID=UPI003BB61908